MEINFKFKIGDFVRLKCSPSTAILIMATLSETCPGGTQLHYIGKGYSCERDLMRGRNSKEWILTTKMKMVDI